MNKTVRITKIIDRASGYAVNPHERVGRLMWLDPDNIRPSYSLFMACINPGYNKSLRTSPVVSWGMDEDEIILVTTNSEYHLKIVEPLRGPELTKEEYDKLFNKFPEVNINE